MPQIRRNHRPNIELIAACGREVSAARARLNLARAPRTAPRDAEQMRDELLLALEHFAAALSSEGIAMPARVRTELEIYRRLGHRC